LSPIEISQRLLQDLQGLRFSAPITHVYNPLDYAWECHADYLRKYALGHPRKILLLGMNPGPWGMAQTGLSAMSVWFVTG